MYRKLPALTLLFGMAIAVAQPAAAKVFLCENLATGEKTFTDHACPSAGQGRKVHVVPVNFNGSGKRPSRDQAHTGVWNSDREHGLSGRPGGERHIQAARSAGATPPSD